MRDIKFRAWVDGKMLDNVGVLSNIGTVRFTANGTIWAFRPSEAELMQYTGLKDKNGKEIYEGDILKGGGTWEVIFNHGEFKLKYIGSGVGAEIANMAPYKRVIGNIHENPDLLEDKS